MRSCKIMESAVNSFTDTQAMSAPSTPPGKNSKER